MPARLHRFLATVALMAAVGFVAASASAASTSHLTARATAPSNLVVGPAAISHLANGGTGTSRLALSGDIRGTSKRCAEQLFGPLFGMHVRPAHPVATADPEVISEFGILRQPRSAADKLPTRHDLGEQLADAGASAYTPSRAVRIEKIGKHGGEYLVPATVKSTAVSAACRAALGAAGVDAYLGLQSLERGHGPGVCAVTIVSELPNSSGPTLPGRPQPRPKLDAVDATCEAGAALTGYADTLGTIPGALRLRALIPDGFSDVRYAFTSGHSQSIPVVDNLATVVLHTRATSSVPSAAKLKRLLARELPLTVTESGTSPSRTLSRPAAYIPDVVGAFEFEVRYLKSVGSGDVGAVGTQVSASCSARTHRCIAVAITTTCNSKGHCPTTRKIYRYRYVGSRPPRGTTGPQQLLTGPIVARFDQTFRRAGKLKLVLNGTPGKVRAAVIVDCFNTNSSIGSTGPAERLAVPSRTRVWMPSSSRRYKMCNISGLVTATHRTHVTVTVVRG